METDCVDFGWTGTVGMGRVGASSVKLLLLPSWAPRQCSGCGASPGSGDLPKGSKELGTTAQKTVGHDNLRLGEG